MSEMLRKINIKTDNYLLFIIHLFLIFYYYETKRII